jgi:stearoyl-CoA desaturase (delta-9 desaturase)
MPMDAPILSSLGPEPWKAPWWKPASGEWSTFFYIVALHILGIAGVIAFPLPGWRIVAATVGITFLGGLGVTIGYHRAIAHRSLRLHPIVEHILIFFAMFNGSGAPLNWTASHRQHHSRVETPEDVSSPWIGGFWWAHLRWLWQSGQVPVQRWCPDMDRPGYRVWSRVQMPLLALSMFGGLFFGPAAFFWLGPIRLLYSLHGQCFVNSSAHMRPGRRDGEESSQNLLWLGLVQLLQGENWHGNHHAKPWAARFGWRRWQIDIGWYTIVLLERLGLATSVRRPVAEHD